MLRTLCLAVLGLVAYAADDMPQAAQAALDKSKTANAKTFLVWKQAVEKDRAALTKTLEGILASESKKKGNDAAVAAIKAKLDELKADDWIAAAIKEQSVDADDLLGEMMTEKELLAAIEGTWYVKDLTGALVVKIVYDTKSKNMVCYQADKLTKVIPDKPTSTEPMKVAKVDGKWKLSCIWSSTVDYKKGDIPLVGSNCTLTRTK